MSVTDRDQEKVEEGVVDVLIVGAGLSGIGAARQMQDTCPERSFAILEGRERIGGTWDLFRYPGIRSDSDMYTMGYDSKPWLNPKAIADGPSILAYVKDAAVERGLEEFIQFDRWVTAANWSTEEASWTVVARCSDKEQEFVWKCNFLFVCSGYYDYSKPYKPDFPGEEAFNGPVVHPQHWPEDLNYAGKKVVVIGSGATAMTLVPSMAKKAAKVTMLQRSPTYVVSFPSEDPIANFLKKILPQKLAYALTRWKNIRMQRWFYGRTRKDPEGVKNRLLSMVRKGLGSDFNVEKHFTPSYNPWDQRMCLIPDGDLYKAIRSGTADVVTGEISSFQETGIELMSGEFLDADVIVSATGLNLVVLGGAEFSVDGRAIDFSKTYSYKGMMFSDVPNLVYTLGYINASWTLRSELVARYVCRLVNYLHEEEFTTAIPQLQTSAEDMEDYLLINDFTPGYMKRAMHLFPRQGDRDPWRNTQNYLQDRKMVDKQEIDDGVLEFSKQGWVEFGSTKSSQNRADKDAA